MSEAVSLLQRVAELSSCDRDMGPVKPGVFTLWPLMVSVALKQPFRGGEGRGCRAGLFYFPGSYLRFFLF